MTISVTSPITGSAQTGLTSPTYTHVSMAAPSQNGKQIGVTALGGTQTNVRVASASDPFWINFVSPTQLKGSKLDSDGNLVGSLQYNVFRLIGTKGVIAVSGAGAVPMRAKLEISVPVGADVNDAVNVRAFLSCFIGWLNQQSTGLGDTVVTGLA